MKAFNKKQILSAVLSILTVNASSVSFAAPSSVKSGGWIMTDSHPGEKSVGTCIAITAGYYGREVMDLIVRLDKTGARPTEVLIRPRSKASSLRAFRASAAKPALFQKLAASSFGQTMFWYIPNGTDDLLAQFKATNQFNATAVGGAGVLPFGMNGSTGALNAMMNNCAGPAAMTQGSAFEKAFLPQNIGSIDSSKVSIDNASAARDMIPAAVIAYKNVLKIEAELARLEAKYAQINAEKRSLDSTLSNLAAKLSSLTIQKTNAQNTIDTATSEIAAYKEKIALKQQELAQAELAAGAALEAIRPFVPEHDRLLKIVNSAQSELNSATSSLNNLDDQISADAGRVSSLENEANDLSWRIRNTQDQESQTQVQLDQAEREFRRFNTEFEIRNRINNDFQLNNIERNISDQRRLSSQLERQLNQDTGARNALDGAYRQCMANAGAQRVDGIVNAAVSVQNLVEDDQNEGRGGRGGRGGDRGDRGERGDRGDRGDRGPGAGNGGPRPAEPTPTNPPPVPTPVPQPPVAGADCSSLASQLATANNQLEQTKRELQRTEANLADLGRQKEHTIRRIENDVYQQKDQLAERVAQISRSLSDLRFQVDRMIARSNDITNFELPNARNELSSSQAQRPGAVSRLQSAQSRLNAVTADYRSYKTSVNYDSLKATVDQTASVVAGLKATIANFKQQVSNRESLIVEKTNLRNSLSAQIDSTNASIASNQARLNQVEQSLVPYNSDKAEVMGRLNDKRDILSGMSRKFGKLLAI